MLISRANCLTKLLLNRSHLLSKTTWAASFSNKSLIHLNSPVSDSNQVKNALGINQFHANSIIRQSDDKTTKKPSILDTPVTAKQSILTEDLVKSYSATEKSETSTQENAKPEAEPKPAGGQGSPNESKGPWSKWFSREHGWKVSLGAIVFITGGSIVYFLTSFGPEKLDENNQPVFSSVLC
jgi:hypothetical protein